jgi:DNA polymerase-3 subunit epsilon
MTSAPPARLEKILIVDTETTGLDPSRDHLVEVACAVYSVRDAALLHAWSLLVSAPQDSVEASRHLHGISAAMIEWAPDRGSVATELAMTFLNHDCDAWAAHNVDFDRSWFTSAPEKQFSEHPWICTMDGVEWPRRSSSRALVAVALAHGVGVVAAHRALADVLTLAATLTRAAEVTDLGTMLRRALREQAIFEVAAADFSAERNALAKAAGFRFDPADKRWRRRMAVEDVAGLPFEVRRSES